TMRTLLAQLAKFGVVGVAATVIDFGVMNLLHYALHLDILIANTAGFTISLVFNYAASMKFVFEHRDGMSRRREFAIFVVLSIVGLLLNDGIVLALNKGLQLEANIAKVAATALVMVYNFVTRKVFLDGTRA
ncbi:GtrA family protein, partial [gut metagenome]